MADITQSSDAVHSDGGNIVNHSRPAALFIQNL